MGNEDQLTAMIREYPWIKEERESFGQPQSFYDFKTHDPAEAQAKRKKLGEKKDTLLKTVNQVGGGLGMYQGIWIVGMTHVVNDCRFDKAGMEVWIYGCPSHKRMGGGSDKKGQGQ